MDARIRPARLADAPGIATVQVASWRAAYRGLVADDFLDAMRAGERTAVWRRRLAEVDPGDAGVFVAALDADVVGFCYAGRWRDDDADDPLVGEVWALYVRPDTQRRGIGTALLDAATDWLLEAGYAAAALWVLTGNTAARCFYEHCGWVYDGTERMLDAGGPVPEVRYRKRLDAAHPAVRFQGG